jgi:hypothetical protein
LIRGSVASEHCGAFDSQKVRAINGDLGQFEVIAAGVLLRRHERIEQRGGVDHAIVDDS